jgi:hypothetical protein
LSGPKSYSVSLTAEQLAKIRAVSEARARYAAAEGSYNRASGKCYAYGVSVEPLSVTQPSKDSSEEMNQRSEIIEAETNVLEHRLAVARAEHIARELDTSRAAFDLSSVDLAVPSAELDSMKASEAGSEASDGSMESFLVVLAQITSDRIRASLCQRLERINNLDAMPRVARAASFSALRVEAARVLRDERRRENVRSRAREMLARIADVQSVDADNLRARLASVSTLVECESIAGAVEEIRARVEGEAARRFILEQSAEVLQELGYVVGREFQSAVLEGKPVFPSRLSLGTYALRLQVPADGEKVLTNVVSEGPSDYSSDVAAEEETCRDLSQWVVGMSRRGVDLTMVHQQPIGRIPVERRQRGEGNRSRVNDGKNERSRDLESGR